MIEKIRARCIEEGDCWLWQGYSANGVPMVSNGLPTGAGKKMVPVRRVVLEAAGKAVKPSAVLVPSCDNPACVCEAHIIHRHRKAHLAAMTKKAIAVAADAERVAKITKSKRSVSRFTINEIRAIRESDDSYQQIADRFGTSKSNIGRIMRHERWKDQANPFAGLVA